MDDIPRSDTSTDPARDPATGPANDPATGPAETVRKRTGNGMLWGVLAVVIAFSAGFLWQYYEASTARGALDDVEQELVLERLRVSLGQAALAANTGNYEPARQEMSAFFGQLQETSPALPPNVRAVADDFLTMRDDVITGLSRGNPDYAAILYGMQETLSNAIDQSLEMGPDADTPTGTGPPATEPAGAAPETGEPGG